MSVRARLGRYARVLGRGLASLARSRAVFRRRMCTSTSEDLPKNALRLKELCDAGDSKAGYELGMAFKHGTDGVKRDFRRAAEYFLVSGKMGHAESMTQIGSMYLVGYGLEKNAEEAYTWLKKAAELEEPDAQVKMAEMHRMGLGEGGLSYERAFGLFSKAARAGHERGLFGLGDMYVRGQHVESNLARGYELMIQSAEKGFRDAQYTLGVMYANRAVPVTVMTQEQVDRREHMARAEFWLLRAAKQEHWEARGRVVELYNRQLSPITTPEEQVRRAVNWALQAAETGLATAQRDLGFMYLVGREGVLDPDPQKAMQWLFYASQQGYSDAAFVVGKIMAGAPTKEMHQKQMREMFDVAFQELEDGPGKGFTLDAEAWKDLPKFDTSPVRAYVLRDPEIAAEWMDQFRERVGREWEGGIDGGLNGLFNRIEVQKP